MDSDKMKNYIIVVLVLVVLVMGFTWIRDGGDSGNSAGSGAQVAAGGGTGAAVAVSDVNTDGNYFKGAEDASVTIIEWSDFQCPFCERFYSNTLQQIEENYVETGKVKLVYKDFPLDSIHPQATPAAIAARCAGDQGKFWEFHDKIFENQRFLSEDSYKQWAGELGLDTATFNECFDNQEHLSAVRQDLVEGQQAGVRGTPGFLVNGKLISGAQPYSVFQQAIEDALAG